MLSRATSGFPNIPQWLQMFPATEDLVSPSFEANSGSASHSTSLLFNLFFLKDKLSQVQTLVGLLISPDQSLPESTSMAVTTMNSLIQEIIGTATSMMFTCQQMTLGSSPATTTSADEFHHLQFDNTTLLSNIDQDRGQSFFSSADQTLDWFGQNYNNPNLNDPSVADSRGELCPRDESNEGYEGLSPKSYDIIELGAEDLLAKYTHHCHVCGKGFKRDANLRMHMRAHGDEYKTSAALSNPMKKKKKSLGGDEEECLMSQRPKKFSCPQKGCRWNQKHAKFQPLKSMICVKKHYKRSHCPKMYVCKRCNQKQFSVLSDLRSHEKHCGDLKWQCSCGSTFSRKDKLIGHVALFAGHAPAISGLSCSGKLEQQALQLQIGA